MTLRIQQSSPAVTLPSVTVPGVTEVTGVTGVTGPANDLITALQRIIQELNVRKDAIYKTDFRML